MGAYLTPSGCVATTAAQHSISGWRAGSATADARPVRDERRRGYS